MACIRGFCRGEIYVKKIPSMKLIDIAKAVRPGAAIKEVGIRLAKSCMSRWLVLRMLHLRLNMMDTIKYFPICLIGRRSKAYSNGGAFRFLIRVILTQIG